MTGSPHQSGQRKASDTWAVRIARWSTHRPRTVVCGAIIACLLALVSISHLQVSTSLSAILGTHSRTAAAMQRVSSEYRSADALLVLIDLPADRIADDASKASLLAFATQLDAALRADPESKRLIASVHFRQEPQFFAYIREVVIPHGAFYLSEDGLNEAVNRLDPVRMREQLARNEAMISAPGPAGATLSAGILRDPLRLFELIPRDVGNGRSMGAMGEPLDISAAAATPLGAPEFSSDGRAILIRIGSGVSTSDLAAAAQLVDLVAKHAARLNTGGLRVELAGSAAIASASSRVIRHDSIVSTLISVGLLYGLFVLFYRRWMAALLIGGVAGAGMLTGIGVLALFISTVSPLAAMIAALLAGLGTDYGIHFLSHYEGYREQGLGSTDASIETARHMATPIVTNCFTSIFGFASLWPSKIQMLSDFALMGAAGLIGALVAVFVLMPALLCMVDRHDRTQSSTRAAFGKLADMVARRPRMCMTSSIVVLVIVLGGAALQGFTPEFESDLTVMHPRPSPALDATGEVIQRFASQGEVVPIEVRASSSEALIAASHDVAQALASQACRDAGIVSVIGLHQLLPDPRTIPRTRAQLARVDADEVLRSFDAAIADSAFEPSAYRGYRDFLAAIVSSGQPPTVTDILKYAAIADRLFPMSTLKGTALPTETVLIVRFRAPLKDRLQRRASIETMNQALTPIFGVTVAGIAAVAEELDEAVRDGLPQSVAISITLVLLWLLIVFRRPMDVLLALVPLVFAGGTTVLFMVATKQRFNPINSVAIPLLDGIAVDAGVFLVSVYRSHGSTRADLLLHLRSTTHAVLLAVATTVTAFGALCSAHTPAVRSLGFVSAVGILASMIGALFLLMPILIARAPLSKP